MMTGSVQALLSILLLAVSPVDVIGRRLVQETSAIDFPGCTFLADTPIAADPDFTILFAALGLVGLNTTLSTLTTPYTLFAPTNEAFQDYDTGSSITIQEGAQSPFLLAGLELLIVPEALLDESTFYDGQVLPTLYSGGNLTVITDEVNGTEQIIIVSPASEAAITTPPIYACNLVIYGVDAAFVPIENVLEPSTPGAIHNITEFLSVYLVPGGPNIPISAIIAAVQDGYVAQVAAAFDEAVENGYISELITLLQQAVGFPNGVPTLAVVANEMIAQSGCSIVRPLIQDLYPLAYSTPTSLGLSPAELESIPEMDPRLASCAISGV